MPPNNPDASSPNLSSSPLAANDFSKRSAASPPRFQSLDVFRGATVAGMILANNPGTWSAMYPPLKHAAWHGWTPTDLIFPFFLFAVGNALAFVLEKLQDAPAATVFLKILKRTAFIFAIGLLLNMFPFVRWNGEGILELKTYENLRILGVLQRIALSFGGAALIIFLLGRLGTGIAQIRRVAITSGILLVGYWLICRFFGDASDPYSLEGFIGTKVDRYLLTPEHLYRGEGVPFDPEGLMSTISTIAQVMIGWLVGKMMMQSEKDLTLVAKLCLGGIQLLFIAYIWQFDFPLNKKIWSSSFILHTSGLAMLVLAVIVYWLDVPNSGKHIFPKLYQATREATGYLFRFFEVFGKNPLFIFVFSGLVAKGLALWRWKPEGSDSWTSPLPYLYRNFFVWEGVDPRLGSLLYSLCLLALYWLIVAWMDRKKIYIKV